MYMNPNYRKSKVGGNDSNPDRRERVKESEEQRTLFQIIYTDFASFLKVKRKLNFL